MRETKFDDNDAVMATVDKFFEIKENGFFLWKAFISITILSITSVSLDSITPSKTKVLYDHYKLLNYRDE